MSKRAVHERTDARLRFLAAAVMAVFSVPGTTVAGAKREMGINEDVSADLLRDFIERAIQVLQLSRHHALAEQVGMFLAELDAKTYGSP